jgi:toxin CcdB
VAPVLRSGEPAVTLTSVPFEFDGRSFVLLVGELTAVDAHRLGRAAGSLSDYEDAIRRALERVFTGF